jgi:hypothetical protein
MKEDDLHGLDRHYLQNLSKACVGQWSLQLLQHEFMSREDCQLSHGAILKMELCWHGS